MENLEVLGDGAGGDFEPARELDRRQWLLEHLEQESPGAPEQVDECAGLGLRRRSPEGDDAAAGIAEQRRFVGVERRHGLVGEDRRDEQETPARRRVRVVAVISSMLSTPSFQLRLG